MPESIRIGEGNVKAVVIIAILCAFLFPSPAFSAFERSASDPFSAGMGQVGLNSIRSGGFLSNPALGFGRGVSIWWEQPYGLKELRSERVVASYPIKDLFLGVSLAETGDEAYREQQILMNGCVPISPKLNAGLSVAWNSLTIDELSSGNSALFNLGVMGAVTEELSAAAVWNNVTQSGLSNYQDKLPTSVAVGALFNPDEFTEVGIDLEQQPGWPTEIRLGVSNRVLKSLTLRGGAKFNPSEYTAGFSLLHRLLGLHYALLWHRELGASHTIGLDIKFR